jgi:hypothetical protein
VQSTLYWSSTTFAASPGVAWVVFLDVGGTLGDVKGRTGLVWPVRGGQ